jgi:iron complex transport system substrate-binding protein
MRIVSLSPSATEIVYALGLGDELVGRSHACDFPEEVTSVPVVTTGEDLSAGTSAWIHDRVAAARSSGQALHGLDRDLLARLEPDLILTQELCEVCAVGSAHVRETVRALGRDVSVVSLGPRSLEGVLNSIATVGAYAEAEDEAVGLVEILRERLGSLENRVLERRLQGIASRRAVVLEWLDPPFAAGHWVPEMVRRSGGWELLGTEGEPSAATTWERLREVEPEVIVLALCGFDARRAARELGAAELPAWFDELAAVRDGELFAVDGSGHFSRPGPRLVEGVEVLAELFDPEGFAGSGPRESWIPLGPVGAGDPLAER